MRCRRRSSTSGWGCGSGGSSTRGCSASKPGLAGSDTVHRQRRPRADTQTSLASRPPPADGHHPSSQAHPERAGARRPRPARSTTSAVPRSTPTSDRRRPATTGPTPDDSRTGPGQPSSRFRTIPGSDAAQQTTGSAAPAPPSTIAPRRPRQRSSSPTPRRCRRSRARYSAGPGSGAEPAWTYRQTSEITDTPPPQISEIPTDQMRSHTG